MTWRLAIRNIFRHTTRSVITVSAIAFGCAAIIFVGGFFEDIFFKMRESYIKAHTGHLQVYRRGFLEHGSAAPYDYLIERPQDVAALLRTVPGVRYAAGRLQFAGLLSTGENTVACIGQGIDPTLEPTIRLSEVSKRARDLPSLGGSVIETGEPLTPQDTYGVILGKGLAAGIDATPGAGLMLVSHTTGGSINAFDVTVRGTFYTSAKAFDDHTLRLPLATAQQLLQTEAVQSLVIMLDRTDDTGRIRAQLAQLFAERGLDLELKSWDELSDFYTNTRKLFGRMFLILKLVIAVIVILSIYNTMNMAVIERTSEIGTIMALGTTPRGVLLLFLAEGAALGVLGGGAGVLLGVALTLGIRWVGIPMPPPPGATMAWFSEPMVVPSTLLFALSLSLVTALISSFLPARNAAELEVAEALRHA